MLRRNFLKLSGVCGLSILRGISENWLYEGFSPYDLDGDGIVNWQDYAIMQNLKIKDDWTISFFWRPECSSREIHGEIPVALIKDISGGYLVLTTDGGGFTLSDGTNDFTVTASDGWKHDDVIKFAIVRDAGTNITLYVETLFEGTLSESDTDVDLAEAVHFVQFSANADKEVKGIGAYGELKMWDSDLATVDVQKVFDLDDTAPAVTINKTVGQMLFERASKRYNAKSADLIELDENTPQAESKCVGSLIKELHYEDTVTSNRPLQWLANGLVYVRSAPSKVYALDPDDDSYTEIVDVRSDEPFVSDDEALEMRGATKLDDGSVLMSCRDNSNHGYIYRGVWDGTAYQWSKSGLFDGAGSQIDDDKVMGYVDGFGWTDAAKNANEVVFGEYDTNTHELDTARRVYYSDDYGQSFYLIYDRDKTQDPGSGDWEEGDGWHIHCVAFSPNDTGIVYVAFGDGAWRKIVKLTCSGDKTVKSNWTATDTPLITQPTAAVAFNGDLYWGHDGSGISATVVRHDTVTDSAEPVMDIVSVESDANAPYYDPSNDAYIFDLTVVDGVLYCPSYYSNGYEGLWATVDGDNWVKLCDEPVNRISDGGDRIWVDYDTPEGYTKAAWLEKPKVQNRKFVYAERGIENLLSRQDSVFDQAEDIGDWNIRRSEDPALSGWDDKEYLFGNGSLKAVGGDFDGASARVTVDGVGIGSVPENSYFVATAYIKPGGKLLEYTDPEHLRPYIEWRLKAGSGQPEASSISRSITTLGDGWYKARFWGKQGNSGAGTLSTRSLWAVLRFSRGSENYPTDQYGDFWFWMDGVSLVSFIDIHYSSGWHIGGDSRADEYLIAPAVDMPSPDELAQYLWTEYPKRTLT